MLAELSVSLWRGGPEGRYETYAVPRRESQTVLDVVTYVQRHIDPTLSYRFACRVGMCGSCAMTVNGRPRWTCRTHVAKVAGGGRLEIGPLENLPLIKDLATDMAPFFEKWQQAKGVFAPSKTRHDAIARSGPTARRGDCRRCGHRMHQLRRVLFRLRYGALEFRISRARPRSIAPGRWSTTSATPAMLPRACARSSASGGCHSCHSHQSCQEHCPLSLNPTGIDRRAEAARRGGVSQGRAEGMNVRLYVWQRATAALMVPLVLDPHRRHLLRHAPAHDRRRHSVAHPRQRRLGGVSMRCSSPPSSIHASIGVRNVLAEWSPLAERRAGQFAIVVRRAAGGARRSRRFCVGDAHDRARLKAPRQRAVDRGDGSSAVGRRRWRSSCRCIFFVLGLAIPWRRAA